MIGNFHVRFLGGKGAVMPPTYPAKRLPLQTWRATYATLYKTVRKFFGVGGCGDTGGGRHYLPHPWSRSPSSITSDVQDSA